MIRALPFLLLPCLAQAETLRIATFNTELSRDGPGLLLRDIQRNQQQVQDVVAVITATAPDVLALQGTDWDLDGQALKALAERLDQAGLSYPHSFHSQPNGGMETDLDLDGDGRRFGPGDAQGWGEFSGQNGIAILSRFPIAQNDVQDFSTLLWRDLPDADLPSKDSQPFPSPIAQEHQRLSSTAHWVVPIDTPEGRVTVMTFHATPPVFDGPEDRNGLRNRDEIRFWQVYLDGQLGPAPADRFVIAGDANLDPYDSAGLITGIQNLLGDPRVQDPAPASAGAAQAGTQGHQGPDSLDTVEWEGAGRLRVDYVLPSADWQVTGSGVYWPAPGEDGHAAALGASRHRLVWVDLTAP
ncbi:endonuclease/exonuclease/phosphatase family protein [Ruegeria sp. HKCCD8929]|uniref:endonuclease/exonuclease/phosphatase family protein n=1 Tax=Ruegeria sp. HKCCD8929 TaxID=2683006 RepID=UPI0014877543|nr:endonuclease/exonuclease/phosphatase family protein [Ruegeria sp. HKCCD8929]